MAKEEVTIVKDDKDRWDKLAIILAPVGGLLTALAVASLGIFGSRGDEVLSEASAPGTGFLADLACEPVGSTPEATGAFIRNESERWKSVIKDAKIGL